MSNTNDDHIHIVQSDDYGLIIAEKYGLTLDQLKAANPGLNIKSLIPGMRLNISTDPACIPDSPTRAYTIESDVYGLLKNLYG